MIGPLVSLIELVVCPLLFLRSRFISFFFGALALAFVSPLWESGLSWTIDFEVLPAVLFGPVGR